MNIKLSNGQTVEVFLSDEAAEEATLGKVKKVYMEKRTKLEKALDEAIQCGIDVNEILTDRDIAVSSSSSNTSSESSVSEGAETPVKEQKAQETPQTPAEQPQEANEPQPEQPQPLSEGSNEGSNKVISGSDADKPVQLNVTKSVDGASVGQEYEIKSETEASEDLKEGEEAEIETVEGRDNMPIAIPTKRRGKAGETNIRIKKTDSREMERRWKDMAQNDDIQFSKAYDVKYTQCTLCSGTGKAMNKQCPKCGGAGEIERSSY